MNFSSMKKIVWIMGIGFLMLGNITLAQNPAAEITLTPPSTNIYQNTATNVDNTKYWPKTYTTEDKNLETADTWFKWLICPDWTKAVEKKWCVPCTDTWVCCGIQLNTNVPFIGNCIELSKWSTDDWSNDANESKVTERTAFPILMWGLTKILVTVIILMGFVGILAGWVMISASGGDDSWASKGKALIGKVIVALALLGASGVILRLINPNFFG